jgi:methanogenic corrinoid protein MtbC1
MVDENTSCLEIIELVETKKRIRFENAQVIVATNNGDIHAIGEQTISNFFNIDHLDIHGTMCK